MSRHMDAQLLVKQFLWARQMRVDSCICGLTAIKVGRHR